MTKYQIVDMIDLSQENKYGRNLPRHSKQVKYIMIHHTGSNKLTWEQLKSLHCGQLHKWPSIGYHYFVRKDGYIYKCNNWNFVVNGCKDFNTSVIHICLEGNYNYDDFNHDFNSLFDAIYADLDSKVRIEQIIKHCDKKNTECPGSNCIVALDSYLSKTKASQSLIWPELL